MKITVSEFFGYRFFLQGKIFFVVFFEIRRLGLCRDPLAGRIAELPALMLHRHDAALGAKQMIFI